MTSAFGGGSASTRGWRPAISANNPSTGSTWVEYATETFTPSRNCLSAYVLLRTVEVISVSLGMIASTPDSERTTV